MPIAIELSLTGVTSDARLSFFYSDFRAFPCMIMFFCRMSFSGSSAQRPFAVWSYGPGNEVRDQEFKPRHQNKVLTHGSIRGEKEGDG